MTKSSGLDVASILSQYDITGREDKFLKTGVLPIDIMFEGKGLPLGAMGMFYAEPGYGKSTVMLSVCKSLAAQDIECWYLSIENNSKLVRDMGLDNSEYKGKFYNLDIATYDELDKITRAFLESNAKFMCIDSITAVSPSCQAVGDLGVEKAAVGLDARIRTIYLKVYGVNIKRCEKSIIYICQARANFDAGWTGRTVRSEGGYGTKHFAGFSFCIQGDSKVKAEDAAQQTDEVGLVAKTGYIWSEKSRYARSFAKIPIMVIFGKGVSNIYSLLQYMYWKKAITSGGSYFKIAWEGKSESVLGRKGRNSWVALHHQEISDDLYEHFDDYYNSLLEGKIFSI